MIPVRLPQSVAAKRVSCHALRSTRQPTAQTSHRRLHPHASDAGLCQSVMSLRLKTKPATRRDRLAVCVRDQPSHYSRGSDGGCVGNAQKAKGRQAPNREQTIDLSGYLRGLSGMDGAFPLAADRGDGARHGGGPDSRENKPIAISRDIYVPDLHIDTLKLKTQIFGERGA